LIKAERTERFTSALEAESQGYKHFFSTPFSLTRNAWYNTIARR